MNHSTRLAACALAMAAIAPAAWAHAELKASTPAAHSALSTAPTDIRLQFSEALEAKFSTIKLLDANDKVVSPSAAQVDPADSTVMHLAVPALPAGRYTVRWTALAHDGHRSKGMFDFSVK